MSNIDLTPVSDTLINLVSTNYPPPFIGHIGLIKEETNRLINILSKNGGYIVESSHAIQPDTKPESIMAIYDTSLKYYY